MKYYISVKHSTNRYHAIKLTSIAIVSEDNRQLFLEGVSNAKIRKAIKKFTSDGTARVFYSYISPLQFAAMYNLFDQQLPENYPPYFSDLKVLEEYLGDKNNFGIQEDSYYPFHEENMNPIQEAQWYKILHEFLIEFDSRIINAEDLVVKIEPKSSYKYNATKTENY